MSVNEAAEAKGPLAASLAAGVETLSLNQTITFTLYVKRVQPLDGMVFWILASLLEDPPETLELTVKGSLHYATDQAQREDETFGVNHVVFTALEPVDDFNAIDPETMWIGEFEGLRFSFSARRSYYQQADLHHYVGDAIYPAFETQVIDTPEELTELLEDRLIVSNSLPIWLALGAPNGVPVYPSYLVAENIEPPYVAVHIPEEGTQVFTAAPVVGPRLSRAQLAHDKVRLTLYGMNNAQALDYLQALLLFMGSSDDVLGLMNMPAVRDAKRAQSELTVLAQKKVIDLEVSYFQAVAYDIARKFILHARVAVTVA